MAELADLVRQHTNLSERELDWLHLLVGEWQLLADLSFADLLLWVRAVRPAPEGFVAVAQIRPVTSQTAYVQDKVGQLIADGKRLLVNRAWHEGRIVREGDPEWGEGIPVREETIPVRFDGRVIAVVARHTNLATARTPSRLELTYLASAADLATMVAEGRFPFPGGAVDSDASPRAGDGLLRLDADGRVAYASPNAVSAYRRLGLAGDVVGVHLGETTARLAPPEGLVDEPISWLVSGLSGREAEVEVEARGVVVRLRSIPLLPGGVRVGTLVLLRDVTELRRRERALLSKDATIREIHHRVKNNLQTVAALLRLQARRLDVPEGRAALEEAVRRVRAIAVVHDTLAQTADGPVDFDEIADRLIAMVADLAGAEVAQEAVVPERVGSFGQLPSAIATPLSLVLTELLQNALEHGLRGRDGRVEVAVRRTDHEIEIEVADDGAGLPAGFSLADSPRLGLQIVRTLVEGDLRGRIELRARPDVGTSAVLRIPVPGAD
ncbi:MAG TPA: histidine kinase N-terminal domain-containing protein [Acidothermaceae bacterium]|nr:histidine kinase N-terminal domain-containing protein [Acidothermaceae bacterium]